MSETKKKEPELRKKELLDYSKPFLKEFLNKEIVSLLFNGAGGVLIPVVLKELDTDGDVIIGGIADCLLKTRFESTDDKKEGSKTHAIEDPTVHYICKQVFSMESAREKSNAKSNVC